MSPTVNQCAVPGSSSGEAAGRAVNRRWRQVRWLVIALLACALLVWQWRRVWPLFPNWRASIALQNRDTDAANSWLQLAEWGVSDHPETAFLRARCQRRLGDFVGVRRYLEKAHKCGVPRQRLEREQWLTLAQSGRMTESEPQLPVLLGDPQDDVHEICEAYSSGYFRLHRYENALEVINAWLADYPKNSYALLLRARVLHRMHNPFDAEKDLQSAVTISPGLAEAQLELADMLRARKRPEEALSHYDKCLGHAKVATQARIGRCISLKMLGQADTAREQLRQIVQEHPDQAQAAYELGLLELEAGEAQSAVEHLQRVKELSPTNLEARYGLAQALQLCGRRKDAEIELAFVDETWRISEKMQALTDRSQANPADIEVRFELGQILFRIGHDAEGARWLQSVLEISPGHSEARRMLDAYHATAPSSSDPKSQQHPPEKPNR